MWRVRSEEEANRAVAYPLNSPSKMVTPELEFPLRAGLKYAEVPGTPDVIRYVFEGSRRPPALRWQNPYIFPIHEFGGQKVRLTKAVRLSSRCRTGDCVRSRGQPSPQQPAPGNRTAFAGPRNGAAHERQAVELRGQISKASSSPVSAGGQPVSVDQGRQPAKNQQNPISDCKIKTCSVATCYNRVTMCYKAVADFLAARENTQPVGLTHVSEIGPVAPTARPIRLTGCCSRACLRRGMGAVRPQQSEEEEIQADGRIRKWIWVEEKRAFLRIILLKDGETVHNAGCLLVQFSPGNNRHR